GAGAGLRRSHRHDPDRRLWRAAFPGAGDGIPGLFLPGAAAVDPVSATASAPAAAAGSGGDPRAVSGPERRAVAGLGAADPLLECLSPAAGGNLAGPGGGSAPDLDPSGAPDLPDHRA